MSTKSQRRAAREVVAAYHEARLGELVGRVGEALDRFRARGVDALRYRSGDLPVQPCRERTVEVSATSPTSCSTAQVVAERGPTDWWERGAPQRR